MFKFAITASILIGSAISLANMSYEAIVRYRSPATSACPVCGNPNCHCVECHCLENGATCGNLHAGQKYNVNTGKFEAAK